MSYPVTSRCWRCDHYFLADSRHGSLCPSCSQDWRMAVAPEPEIKRPKPAQPDPVNHPPHYKKHPSGVECITVTEHFNFCLGNAVKYIWRAGEKGDAIEDLRKAVWYLNREIERRTNFPPVAETQQSARTASE